MTGSGLRDRTDRRTVQFAPLADLRFDPENPRLPHSVDGSSEHEVLRWMLEDATLLELMGSIAEQGYFPGEPLLTCPWKPGSEGPPFKVVEGNRRLGAVLLLLEPRKAPIRRSSVTQLSQEARERPTHLPILVFNTRDEILGYLGYRHVTGIKEWDPLAKARYLRQLWNKTKSRSRGEKLRELARRIGSRTDYVTRLLSGLRIYDHIVERSLFGLKGMEEEDVAFSVLTTALSYRSIADFIGLRDEDDKGPTKEENLRDLVEWLYVPLPSGRPVVGESRQLRELAAVLTKPAATTALRKGASLSDALLLTEEPLRVFQQAVRQARDALKVANEHLHKVPQPQEADLETLTEIATLARDLMNLVRIRLEGAEEEV